MGKLIFMKQELDENTGINHNVFGNENSKR